jgi:RND family efflux transporter MFP subunit
MRKWRWWLLCLGVIVLVGGSGLLLFWKGSPELKETARGVFRRKRPTHSVRVEVVHPTVGMLERVSTQPGTVMAYESVDLFAEASGYLKRQTVDIGDIVKKGAPLIEVDVPDLEKQVERAKAVQAQAQARVGQAKSSLERAKAEAAAARAAIPQAEAAHSAASAKKRYEVKRYARERDLWKQGGLEERLVDEAEDRKQAAIAAEKAAAGAVETAKAQEAASRAKIEQARADIAEAEAQVEVARAEVERVAVQVGFAKIKAPFDGVITRRTLFPGGYVRSAREGERTPLLSIDRTDKVRVVVQVPDRDAPYADRGDPAIVEVDALAGKTFRGAISRTQGSQDTLTRTMRVEIDLPNPTAELRPGMFGKVTISLQKATNALTIPSGCLIGGAKEGHGQVYCVRAAKAVLVPIGIGMENGVRAEVLSGLTAADLVVRRYSGTLANGAPVTVAGSGDEVPAKEPKNH